jgi:hypothetical protein
MSLGLQEELERQKKLQADKEAARPTVNATDNLDLSTQTGGPGSKLGLADKVTAPSLFEDRGSNDTSFDTVFGNQEKGIVPTNVGYEANEVSPQAVFEAGGPQAIAEGERSSIGIGTALDITDSLLGKTTGTQRADPVELSKFQQILLGVSDLIAITEGRTMPSTTLKSQKHRLQVLDKQQERMATINGLQVMQSTLAAVSSLPRDQRVQALALKVPELEKMSPGLGAIGLTLADNPNEAEATAAFMNNPDNFKGTMAETLFNYATAIGMVNSQRAGNIIEEAIKGGIFTQTIDNVGPTILEESIPAQIEAGRRMGGEMERMANVLAADGDITPEQYLAWQSNLPEASKVDDAYAESLAKSPERYLAVSGLRGMTTAALEQKRKEAEIKGEFSAPVAMVNTRERNPDGSLIFVGGPSQSERIRSLGPEFVPMAINHDAIVGTEEDGSDGPFGPPGPTTTARLQKTMIDLRVNSDELIGIQEGYRRDLQTFQSKAKNGWLSMVSTFDGELSAEDIQFKREFISNKTRTLQALSAKLNRLSGAAVSPQEFARIAQTQPADDDNPIDFQVKMDTAIALNQFAIARLHAWEMMPEPHTMSQAYRMTRGDVRTAIQEKSSEMYNAYADKFPDLTHEQLMVMTQRDTADAFGVRAEDFKTIMDGGLDVTLSGGD